MLSTKDKKVLKTFDYIIKNKKKDLSPYLSKKLSTMTKLKGGSGNGENNGRSSTSSTSSTNSFYSVTSSEKEYDKKQKNYENTTGFERNEVVKYQNEEYRIKSFLNNSKVEFYNKKVKNKQGKN